MGLISTARFIINHPLSRGRKLANLSRFACWQIGFAACARADCCAICQLGPAARHPWDGWRHGECLRRAS